MWESRRIAAYWTSLRGASPAEALVAFGRFAAGRDCWLAARGTVLCGKGTDLPVFDREGRGVPMGAILPDRGLDALGLELRRVGQAVPPAAPDQPDRFAMLADVGALVCRAGLMMRCLTLAYAHLEGRESGGEPTLHLPLVKATFTDCASLGDRIHREAAKHLEGLPGLNLAEAHAGLSAATARAAKLMGGHGYLAGQINAIETLSLLIVAGFTPMDGQRRAA